MKVTPWQEIPAIRYISSCNFYLILYVNIGLGFHEDCYSTRKTMLNSYHQGSNSILEGEEDTMQ